MQIIISREKAQEQQLCKEWYGNCMEPPYRFSMQLTAEGLVFRAARAAAASVHPEAREGEFREELWKYDAAEFFISTPSGDQYMEFNLSPNGAWWASVFCAPRVVAAGYENWRPQVTASGNSTDEGWACEALIPRAALEQVGIEPANCKLAVCAILSSPQQVFLTSALPCDTQPDFHRPDLWEQAVLN